MTIEDEWEEQGLLSTAMRQLGEGDPSGLVALLRRGKPISPAVADFVGAMVAGQELNGFAFSLSKVSSRGRPRSDDARERRMKAVFYTDFLVREGSSVSGAAREAGGKFDVDHDAVRQQFALLSSLDLPILPGYHDAVAEAEANPD